MPASPLAGCDEAMAEFYLSQPCWAEGGKSDGRGLLCGTIVDCDHTFQPQGLSLVENSVQALDGKSEIKIWVGTVLENPPKVAVMVIHDDNGVFEDQASYSKQDIIDNNNGKFFTLALASIKVGHQVAFWYGTTKLALSVDSILAPAVGVDPVYVMTTPAKIGLTIKPADGDLAAEDPTFVQLADMIAGQGASVRVDSGPKVYWLTIPSIDQSTNTVLLSTLVCDTHVQCPGTSSATGKTVSLGMNMDVHQTPWTEGELANAKLTIKPASCLTGPCIRLTVLGEEKTTETTTKTNHEPSTAGLELKLASEPDINASTGEVRFHGEVCYRGAGTSNATTVTLAFKKGEEVARQDSTIPISALAPGCKPWTDLGRVMEPGQYTATAYLSGHKETAYPKSFVVPPRSGTPAYKPDLHGDWNTDLQLDQAAGKMTIKLLRVCNSGVGKAGASKVQITHVIKSGGSTVEPRTLDVRELATSDCHEFPDVEFSVQPGDYTLIVKVNSAGIPEDNKENNVLSLDYTMPGSSTGTTETATGIDLKIGYVKQLATATGSAKMEVQVCNRGTVQSPPFQVGLYVSRTAKPTCGDPVTQTVAFPALEPTACEVRQTPQFMGAEGAVVYLLADSTCVVEEAEEGNNATATSLKRASAASAGNDTATKRADEDWATRMKPSEGCAIGGSPSASPLLCVALVLLVVRRRRRQS